MTKEETEREKDLEQRCELLEYEIEQQQKEIEFYKEIIKGILHMR